MERVSVVFTVNPKCRFNVRPRCTMYLIIMSIVYFMKNHIHPLFVIRGEQIVAADEMLVEEELQRLSRIKTRTAT
jgi:hypothetical protein